MKNRKHIGYSYLLLLPVLFLLSSCRPVSYELKFSASMNEATCSEHLGTERMGFGITQRRTRISGEDGGSFTLIGNINGRNVSFDLFNPSDPECADHWIVTGTLQEGYKISGDLVGGDCRSVYSTKRQKDKTGELADGTEIWEFIDGCAWSGSFEAEIVNAPKEVREAFDKALSP